MRIVRIRQRFALQADNDSLAWTNVSQVAHNSAVLRSLTQHRFARRRAVHPRRHDVDNACYGTSSNVRPSCVQQRPKLSVDHSTIIVPESDSVRAPVEKMVPVVDRRTASHVAFTS
jgi:hypothetical protein